MYHVKKFYPSNKKLMSFNIGKSMKKLNLNWVNSDEEKKIKELFQSDFHN